MKPQETQSSNIAIVIRKLTHVGGLEKYTMRLANAFAHAGQNVTIFTTQHDKKIFPTARKVALIPPISGKKMHPTHFNRAYQEAIKGGQFDVVFNMDCGTHFTHARLGNGVYLAYLQRKRYPTLIHKWFDIHLNPKHRRLLKLESAAYSSPLIHQIFTNSQMCKNELITHHDFPESKITVVHNGVEWTEMQPDFDKWIDQKQHFCKEHRLDPNQIHLLFIGNGYGRKGLGELLAALSIAKAKDYCLHVVGADKNREKYVRKAAKLKVADQVRFWGPISPIRPFFQLADVAILPSLYDPFANATVEALAMGLFVITSKTNGGHEVITPECGIVVDDIFDRVGFAQAIERGLKQKKSWHSSQRIRNGIEYLDFSNQLTKIVSKTLDG
ncbi:MAG: D-inositol-3-phosphate glycosyltransferase [Chlamydiia bacterium]|nr:D-inositol-3-phosphate glycosyltransferase [Chlamydiia bacterium]